MAKTRFRTPWTSMENNSPVAETVTGVSKTIPDQTLTVRDILLKFASGTLDELSKELEYNEDMPDLRGLDISELYDMRADAQMDIDEINAMIKLQEQTTGNQEDTPPPAKKKGKSNPSPSDDQQSLNTDE